MRDARRADLGFHAWSLDAPLAGDDETASLADLLGEEDGQVEHALDMAAVSAHWKELPERQQRILLLRFYGNKTQAEIGETLGISQMHVSRLLTQSLDYLRECLLGSEEQLSRSRRIMKTATGLSLVAIGAILAFAVSASPPGVNINIVGWIIMLTGVAGFLIPRRASGWLRSRVLVRTGSGKPGFRRLRFRRADGSGTPGGSVPAGQLAARTADRGGPARMYCGDPAELASAILRDAELAGSPDDDPQAGADLSAGTRVDGWADPEPVSFDEPLEGRGGPGRGRGDPAAGPSQARRGRPAAPAWSCRRGARSG